jgi:LysW-gamma-L-lysine carboxypeptidase
LDPVALLENLLNIYSPSGQEAEAVRFLVEQMRALGFEAFVDEAGNAVGAYGEGPQTVMLLGHIDTVPGFIPVTRIGDQLWGRGAVDAKGPLACFVAAASRAREKMAGRRVVVIGAVEEEGNSRGAHYIKNQYHPSYTLIGEPNGWDQIALGYKGSAWYEYRVQRAVAHTSAQMQESACEAAVQFWNRLTAWASARNAGQSRTFDQFSPTLRRLASESDGFTESASLKFNVRLPLEMTVTACDKALHTLLNEAQLTLLDGVPAYRSEKNTPLVRALLKAIRQAGGTPGFKVKNGTSDMNVVGPVWNTPIVAYGPGDSALDHTPDEHIALPEYEQAIAVLAEALPLI